MGKYADSVKPKEGAAIAPDPPQHDKIEKPKAEATQGVRTTQSGQHEASKK
jgi:hypothetical protein